MPEELRLRGRLFLDAEIHAVTGLHIAGPGARWPSAASTAR
jgi:hypothetical protein